MFQALTRLSLTCVLSKMLKGKHFITMKILANRMIGSNFSSKGCLALSLASLYPISEHILGFSDLKITSNRVSNTLIKGRNYFVGKNGLIKNISDEDKINLILSAPSNPLIDNNRKILSFMLKSTIFRFGGEGPNHFVVRFADGTLFDPAIPFFINNYDSLCQYYYEEGRKVVGMRSFPYLSYAEIKSARIC